MPLVSPSNPLSCVPLRVVDKPGLTGSYLGGRPPAGVSPPASPTPLRYFATVPIATEPDLFASIFVADLETIMPVRARANDADHLKVVVHPLATRATASSLQDSPLSEHALELLPVSDDWIEDEEGARVVRPGHKLGGRPHLVRERATLVATLNSLRETGYFVVAQFDFPTDEDSVVSGDWPFADGVFVLLGREPFGHADWRWYWDF
jgi:hypothetical protein